MTASEVEVEAAARAMNSAPWDDAWIATREERERAKERARRYARAALIAAAGARDECTHPLDAQFHSGDAVFCKRCQSWTEPAQPVVETERWGVFSYDDGVFYVSDPPTRDHAERNADLLSADGESCEFVRESMGRAMANAVAHAKHNARRSQPAPRTVTEWGVRYPDGCVVFHGDDEERARKIVDQAWSRRGYTVVRREVTEWVEVQP